MKENDFISIQILTLEILHEVMEVNLNTAFAFRSSDYCKGFEDGLSLLKLYLKVLITKEESLIDASGEFVSIEKVAKL